MSQAEVGRASEEEARGFAAGLRSLLTWLQAPAAEDNEVAALVREAPRARAQRAAGDDDIEDPYRRPDEVFGLVLDRIETATRSLLDRISPVAGHAPSPEGGALLAGPSPIGVKAGPGR